MKSFLDRPVTYGQAAITLVIYILLSSEIVSAFIQGLFRSAGQ